MISERDCNIITRRTAEAILLSYSPNFPLLIKEGVNFYIPDYAIVLKDFKEALKGMPKPSLEKRINQGIDFLTSDIIYEDWNDLSCSFYSQFSNLKILDSDDNPEFSECPTFKFKAGIREIKLQKFEEYWTAPEQIQWRQFWELMQTRTLEELRKRGPCHDCLPYKGFTEFE